jgi:hypothetical protein
MQKFRPFEKTSGLYRSGTASMNGKSPITRDSSPPSPADDPLDKLARAREELKSVTDDEPDTGQFDVSKEGVKAKGIPNWAMSVFPLGLLLLLGFVAWLKWGR